MKEFDNKIPCALEGQLEIQPCIRISAWQGELGNQLWDLLGDKLRDQFIQIRLRHLLWEQLGVQSLDQLRESVATSKKLY